MQTNGFVDLSMWRLRYVSGSGALEWLDSLVSADLKDLSATRLRRTLLLSPTGRIKAEFHVGLADDGYVLVQDPAQPRPVDELLGPYVLSSDVTIWPPSSAPWRPA